jgi:hypothetical protein
VSLDIFVGLQGLLLHVEIGSRATALGSRRLQPGG